MTKNFTRPEAAIDGDALFQDLPLAVGLYDAMLSLRTQDDINPSEFQNYAENREVSIEEPTEIWRSMSGEQDILVSFIKDYSLDSPTKQFWYIAVTLEDSETQSHTLLFSFPTQDKNLVQRYQNGEQLNVEDVEREDSH
ncbi:MAG: hypothetical protein HAW60_03725 [Bdellovibrionales bacterium]|nr:hypothetical protein [Bdellovibrionales bacterium]